MQEVQEVQAVQEVQEEHLEIGLRCMKLQKPALVHSPISYCLQGTAPLIDHNTTRTPHH